MFSEISNLLLRDKTNALYIVFQQYNYRIYVHLLNISILFSYVRNFFLDKSTFICDILRNFAIGGLSLNKRWILKLLKPTDKSGIK